MNLRIEFIISVKNIYIYERWLLHLCCNLTEA